MTSSYSWSLPFLQPAPSGEVPRNKVALIILNQPFSKPLLTRLWHASDWRCCADGGANRLYDLPGRPLTEDLPASMRLILQYAQVSEQYIPDLVKGDLDSLRSDVRQYYEARVGIFLCHSSAVV